MIDYTRNSIKWNADADAMPAIVNIYMRSNNTDLQSGLLDRDKFSSGIIKGSLACENVEAVIVPYNAAMFTNSGNSRRSLRKMKLFPMERLLIYILQHSKCASIADLMDKLEHTVVVTDTCATRVANGKYYHTVVSSTAKRNLYYNYIYDYQGVAARNNIYPPASDDEIFALISEFANYPNADPMAIRVKYRQVARMKHDLNLSEFHTIEDQLF